MSDVRIGVIGTDNTHAYTYCAYINGWAEAGPIPVRLPNGTPVPDMYLWATLLRRLGTDPDSGVPLPKVAVTSIWSADAERVARACGIETVCATPEEVCRNVDAVMVLSERPETHLPYAQFALEKGYGPMPTSRSLRVWMLVGKSSSSPSVTARLATPARRSASHPNCSPRGDYTRTQPSAVRAIHVQCPLGQELYGIHAIEMINLFLGHQVASVEAMAAPDRQVVLLTYANGTTAVFEHLNFLRWPTYNVELYAETWHHHVTIDDPAPTLLAFTKSFSEFARGGPTPVPAAESLRLIEILGAAQQSCHTGRPITL